MIPFKRKGERKSLISRVILMCKDKQEASCSEPKPDLVFVQCVSTTVLQKPTNDNYVLQIDKEAKVKSKSVVIELQADVNKEPLTDNHSRRSIEHHLRTDTAFIPSKLLYQRIWFACIIYGTFFVLLVGAILAFASHRIASEPGKEQNSQNVSTITASTTMDIVTAPAVSTEDDQMLDPAFRLLADTVPALTALPMASVQHVASPQIQPAISNWLNTPSLTGSLQRPFRNLTLIA